MSKWMETKDGRIIDVHYVGKTSVVGFLIKEDDFKLRYGEIIEVDKSNVVEYDNSKGN